MSINSSGTSCHLPFQGRQISAAPKKTLPEREGGPLAVGESAPGAGSESTVIPREKSIRPIQKSLLAESKEMKNEQINPM